ncbi:phthiocerol/phthiodiolone dimycocerosyl transferase family protein [Haloechinothrix halophila]|uniref:phthiocerol/phthiodiolone dimycocerosyl transferase family protein n=1 Tax=Haloechinothrix halophila TaxID=1069073 RepID=UPI0012FB7240|nr:condensation domain-containing protein [Haloechinothrix halophila]
MERYLDNFESWSLGDGEPLVAEYEGDLDGTEFATAVNLLGKAYPVVRARVRYDAGRPVLYAPTDSSPKLTVLEGGESALLRAIAANWNPQKFLVEFTLVRGTCAGYVVMRMDHSVSDGHSLYALFGELWNIYTALTSGNEVDIRPGASLPKSHDEVLQTRFSDWNIPNVVTNANYETAAMHPAAVRRVTLDEKDSRNIRNFAGSNSTTVQGLVGGAVLVAQRRYIADLYPDSMRGNIPMTCRSSVDLRNRTKPAIGATETTSLIVAHKSEVSVSQDSDPLAIGRQISTQIKESIANKCMLPPLVGITSRTSSCPESRLLSASISNVGALNPIVLPGGVRLNIECRLFRAREVPCYGAWTIEGRFSLSIGYPSDLFCEQTLNSVTDYICKNLEKFGVSSQTVLDH